MEPPYNTLSLDKFRSYRFSSVKYLQDKQGFILLIQINSQNAFFIEV